MPRHRYSLTDATVKTFKDHVPDIAEEADVTPRYVYGILAGSETDPFAPFEHYYKATLRAGHSTCHWDNRLAGHRAKYEKLNPAETPLDCLAQKIHSDADTTNKLIEAIKDGQITPTEGTVLLNAIAKERQVLELLETIVHFQLGIDEQKLRRVG